jgi:pimeloyl-ACP methyl ester carboxylesterase
MANSNPIKLRAALVVSALLLGACESSQQPIPQPSVISHDKPLIVMMATDADATLNGNVVVDHLPSALRAEGYELFAMDLPCHSTGQPNVGLTCWRERVEAGDSDLFTRFCRELSAEITRRNVTRAVVIGQSRGGYVASICAALDFRLSQIILLMPVTDLQKLYEFDGYVVNQNVYGLGQYYPALYGRPISILIGAIDSRVNTESAIRFAIDVDARIELTDSSDHELPGNGATSQWVLDRITER